jgi:uncharacterized protein (DUF427 family)
MALTAANGPFSGRSPGRFNVDFETPTGAALFFEPAPQRLRVLFAKETVADSIHARLLHETRHLPVYYFPESDVRADLLVATAKRTRCPHKGEARYWSVRVGERLAENAVWGYPEPIGPASFLAGHLAFYWNAMDEWFAEDAQLFGHPRDPYTRIDVYPSSRHVRILVDGEVLADTRRSKALFESNHPTRWYVPPEDVRTEFFETSSYLTRCAYKGSASHFHVRVRGTLHEDLAWTYREPQHDGRADRVAVVAPCRVRPPSSSSTRRRSATARASPPSTGSRSPSLPARSACSWVLRAAARRRRSSSSTA